MVLDTKKDNDPDRLKLCPCFLYIQQNNVHILSIKIIHVCISPWSLLGPGVSLSPAGGAHTPHSPLLTLVWPHTPAQPPAVTHRPNISFKPVNSFHRFFIKLLFLMGQYCSNMLCCMQRNFVLLNPQNLCIKFCDGGR